MDNSTGWYIIAAAAAGIFLISPENTTGRWVMAGLITAATTISITAQVIDRKKSRD